MDRLITAADNEFSKSWIKAIFQLRASIDRWAKENLQEIWEGQYQSRCIYLLLSIEKEGSKASTLIKEHGISKQAMSKILQNLISLNLIDTRPDVDDQRSKLIFLTEKGSTVLEKSLTAFSTLIYAFKESADYGSMEESRNTLNLALRLIQEYKK